MFEFIDRGAKIAYSHVIGDETEDWKDWRIFVLEVVLVAAHNWILKVVIGRKYMNNTFESAHTRAVMYSQIRRRKRRRDVGPERSGKQD